MDAILQTPFNAAQVEILQLFSQGLTDDQLKELQRLLIDFRFRLLDEQVEKLATQKGLSVAQIDSAAQEHRRTTYRSKQQHLSRKNPPASGHEGSH